MKDGYSVFDEYIRQGEPDKKQKASIWRAAIGLQAVDGLQTSEYLKETARKHIEGEINIDQARELIKHYYKTKSERDPDDDEKEEADKVSSNITKVLSSFTLDFSSNGYIALHRRIFEGVLKHAGRIRDYDITKCEWVLDNDTVHYLNWEDLRGALDYDIEQEKEFNYKGISRDELIAHIAKFVSSIWQIHPFEEGNTRTTAVFAILYLRSIGFIVDNDMFANNSWYFRNALVRANYRNAVKGIDYSSIYLERFFRNLLFGEQWDLRNRYLHINPTSEWREQPNLADRTSTGQVPDKLDTVSINVSRLIEAMGESQLSIKELLSRLNLAHRENFIKNYLSPAIKSGCVTMLYPDSPHHPRQKYLLTEIGKALL